MEQQQAGPTDMDFDMDNCRRVCRKDDHKQLLNFAGVGADPVRLAQELRGDQQAAGSGTASQSGGGSGAVGGMLAPASDDESLTEVHSRLQIVFWVSGTPVRFWW